ncbi:MAG: hypothetical protein ACI8UR_000352 [Natronomonas sp.]|uniref:DUF7124 domain-containing protein n=1 Tax=Natronomonas sp. TaxID=2184060 RepID=UPI0039890F5A
MSLTLAFELAALRRLADPEEAVTEARTWSENVGIVSDRPPYVLTKFTRDNHLRNDFEPASEPAAETLGHLLEHFETERFVFVADEMTEQETPDGWEHRDVAEAADRAGWELATDGAETDAADTNREPSRQRDDWP